MSGVVLLFKNLENLLERKPFRTSRKALNLSKIDFVHA